MLDDYTYAADPDRLTGAHLTFKCDISQPISTRLVDTDFDYILHLAAETSRR
jgi:hypothetical protein